MNKPHLLAALLSLTVACGTTDTDATDTETGADVPVTLIFDARVGDAVASCGVDYAGIGAAGSTVQLRDLRFYVHDLVLLTDDGAEYPVTLDDDDLWQDGTVALLDFEDASGDCSNGNPNLNDVVLGTVSEDLDFTAVRFTLGVPFADNHGDASSAETPLNVTSLFWSWQTGYKFLRIDLSTEMGGWMMHLGSTGCEADEDGNVTSCSEPNRPVYELDLDPETGSVVLDVAELVAAVDLTTDGGGAMGCMSGVDDPECAPTFEALGLGESEQTVFSAE